MGEAAEPAVQGRATTTTQPPGSPQRIGTPTNKPKYRVKALDIWVDDERVGRLTRERSAPGEDVFRFVYERGDLPESKAISLTLPTSSQSYRDKRLFSAFQRNIPEMNLRMFPAWSHREFLLDQMGVLAAAGNRNLSHFRIAAPDQRPEEAHPLHLNWSDLNDRGASGSEHFTRMVNEVAHIPGVDGVQPKLLARIGEDNLPHDPKIRTLRLDTHLIKIASKPSFSGMPVAEWCALKAAAASGLSTPDARLSWDGELLAVARFDLQRDKQGRIIGSHCVEELCQLTNRTSEEKYDVDAEEMAEVVSNLHHRLDSSPERDTHDLFRLIVFHHAIQNGDAHMKNFAMMYHRPGSPARLSPVYDVLTTTPFSYPEDELGNIAPIEDHSAFLVNGTQYWRSWADLLTFAERSCNLARPQALEIMREVGESVRDCLATVTACSSHYECFSRVGPQIGEIWDRNTQSLLRHVDGVQRRLGLQPPRDESAQIVESGTRLSD